MEDRKKLAEKIFFWQQGQTFFTAQLFDLFAKADSVNMRKLAKAFPEEASIYAEFMEAPSLDEFYARYNEFFKD